ncbi:beta-lactamase family protein [Permianibacter sp. IMCC34836]|uniref:serine hydrolase domain-containing protein n=1 Tax=Permianibacter fluminis TaxID=2738515 RepID=UPI001551AB68|nr:serine hydrolase domain-containing protein [Permianibacter fluminis]NQD36613.1 beta-lactamase family protein [Permianibacter fluminis]
MSEVDERRRRSVQAAGLALLGAVLGPGLTACAHGNASARAVAPRAAMPWQLDADFLADLPRLMRAYQVPGVAMATVHDGELTWCYHTGLANAETGAIVTGDSLFEAASLSKPVFAWLVLRLVDEQRLNLDQPLTSLLRPSWLANDPNCDRITARHVLCHSTGLVNWRKQPLTEKLQPAFTPGTQIRYSGEAYFWLQLVVEQLMNASLETLAQRYLFAPAGMRDSSFAWDDALAARSVFGHAAPDAGALVPLPPQGMRAQWQLVESLARSRQKPLGQWRYADAEQAYAALADKVPTDAVGWPGDLMANCAASLRCTAADYGRFLRVLMAMADAPKLSESSQQLYTETQIETRPDWSGKTLGWNREQTRVGPVLYHGGNNANQFKTFAIAEPTGGRALVVMTNGGGGSMVYQQIVRAATGRDLLAFEP